jgi:hypothetical protein
MNGVGREAGEEDARMATMTSDQLGKLATQMAETSDKIARLKDMGKDAPKGTIRGLEQRLDALRAVFTEGGGINERARIETGHAR